MDSNTGKKKDEGYKDDDIGKDHGQCRQSLPENVIDITEENGGIRKDNATVTTGTMASEEEFVFRRRSALMRTPPAKRASSAPNEGKTKVAPLWRNTTPAASEEEKEKRKRGEDSPQELNARETQHKKQKEDKKHREVEGTIEKPSIMGERGRETRKLSIWRDHEIIPRIINLMKRIDKETTVLRKLINENKNTKVQIKDSVAILDSLVSQLVTREMLQQIEEGTGAKAPTQATAPEETTTPLMEALRKTMTDSSTQTERYAWQTRNENRAANIRRTIVENRGYEGFKLLPKGRWPEEVFIVAKEAQGNPLWDGNVADVALVVDKGDAEDKKKKSIIRQAGKKFPELLETWDGPAQDKGCTTLIYETKIFSSQTQHEESGRRTVSRAWAEEDEMVTYMNLLTLKENMDKMGIQRLGFLVSDGRYQEMKQMCEHIFCGTGMKLPVHSASRKPKPILSYPQNLSLSLETYPHEKGRRLWMGTRVQKRMTQLLSPRQGNRLKKS